jgi:hypothetical protein
MDTTKHTVYTIHFHSERSSVPHSVWYRKPSGTHGHNRDIFECDTVEAAIADQKRVMAVYGWTGIIRVIDVDADRQELAREVVL